MNVWDKLSKKYDTLWVQKYSLKPTREKVLSLLGERNTNYSLLDVGCGTGQLLSEIQSKFPNANLLGIDKSPEMIKMAKEKNTGIDFYCVDVADYQSDRKFDFLTCCHSFPYYPDKSKILQTLSTLLKDNGKAIFINASINNNYDKFIMSIIEKTAEKAEYLSKSDFCSLASNYFVVEDVFTIKEKPFMPSICGFVLGEKL